MSLNDWAKAGWLRPHQTNRQQKRNVAEYDCVGQVSAVEARDLAEFVRELRETVVAWLEQVHPELSPWRK